MKRSGTHAGVASLPGWLRQTLAAARALAASRGERAAEPAHVVLALLDRGFPPVEGWSGDPGELRARIERELPAADGRAAGTAVDAPASSWTRKVIEVALHEARALEEAEVQPIHLLLALARLGYAPAGALAEVGLDRARLARSALAEGPGAGFQLRADPASAAPLHDQIVSQIREAVATGRLRPGARLPTVREAADRLDVSTGTVARAYAELEKQGVVYGEGARGTWVAQPLSGDLSEPERRETLHGLLRPVVVAAYHLGASEAELRDALRSASSGIFAR